MACGLPILTTNTGGLPELVNNNTGICLKTEKVGKDHLRQM